jgi:hypothetical protein
MGQGNTLTQRGLEDRLVCCNDELFAAVCYRYLEPTLIHHSVAADLVLD